MPFDRHTWEPLLWLLCVLLGAVFSADIICARSHSEIGKHVDKLEKLEGPVYDIKRDHHFKEIRANIEKIKSIQGPVYDIGQSSKHHFTEIEKHVDSLKELKVVFLI